MPRTSTILIVEDDVDLRRMFRTALVVAGFDVREAGDGYDALRIIDENVPDLVVLDLGLPRIDGFSVQADIAARSATRHIPVVIVTGASEELGRLDVACVLKKPVSPDDLVSTVRKCLLSGTAGAGLS